MHLGHLIQLLVLQQLLYNHTHLRVLLFLIRFVWHQFWMINDGKSSDHYRSNRTGQTTPEERQLQLDHSEEEGKNTPCHTTLTQRPCVVNQDYRLQP